MLNIHKKCIQSVYNIYKKCTFAPEDGQTIPVELTIMQADYYLIKQERFNQGLTQKDLAQKAKICLSVVLKAERGASISPKSNKAIRDALGLK